MVAGFKRVRCLSYPAVYAGLLQGYSSVLNVHSEVLQLTIVSKLGILGEETTVSR